MLQMRCVNSYILYRNVFSLFLNMSSEMSSARSSAGRLFQTPRSLNSEATEFTRKTVPDPEVLEQRSYGVQQEDCSRPRGP